MEQKMENDEYLSNPAEFEKKEHRCTDPDCLDCDEPIYFAMHDKHHKFSLSLTTLIECLKFAENEGAIPPIDISWWGEISNRVPSIHVLQDNTIRS